MKAQPLNPADQEILLKVARQAVEKSVQAKPLPEIKLALLPDILKAEGASFVTLTIEDRLRGCIGTIEAYQPLAKDVQEHAVGAALQDPRFPPVRPAELSLIQIEVSALSPKTPLYYDTPEDLLDKIRPGTDGIVIQDGFHKATFLPQVWDKLPDPAEFLAHLCIKMGSPGNLWRKKPLEVYVYQVQEFHE